MGSDAVRQQVGRSDQPRGVVAPNAEDWAGRTISSGTSTRYARRASSALTAVSMGASWTVNAPRSFALSATASKCASSLRAFASSLARLPASFPSAWSALDARRESRRATCLLLRSDVPSTLGNELSRAVWHAEMFEHSVPGGSVVVVVLTPARSRMT